ncbi:hypothetical protein ACS0TY_028199 [Phlomoides rotata]
MNQDLFKKLPSEITVNILSRLPVRTVVCCKCVCKPWLHLLGTREFVKSHLSKSVPALLVLEQSKLCRLSEFEDSVDLERHEHHYNPVTKFGLPYHGDDKGNIYGSVNGLLFLRDKSLKPDGLFICNPITRDYIKLNCPQEFVCSDKHVVAYGFGVSKLTGEHKVVGISHECHVEGIGHLKISIPEWQVYTLGTGSWRRIAPHGPHYLYGGPSFLATRNFGPFLNGNLHWLAYNMNGCPWISCFDLETETFCGISSPLPRQGSTGCMASLCALGDCLCLCDSTSDAEIVMWLMSESGDEKAWVKVYVISKTPDFFPFRFMIGLIFPLKVFKDGDILLEWDGCFLFRYSEKDKLEPFDMFCSWHEAIIHTPSFLSLKSFDAENVSTF